MAEKYIFDAEEEGREGAGGEPLEKALRERLRSVKNAGERRTIAGLAREIGKLPADLARAGRDSSCSRSARGSCRSRPRPRSKPTAARRRSRGPSATRNSCAKSSRSRRKSRAAPRATAPTSSPPPPKLPRASPLFVRAEATPPQKTRRL